MNRQTTSDIDGNLASRLGHPSGQKRFDLLLLAVLLMTVLCAGPAAAQVTKETTDVFGQGSGGPVVAMNGATLLRSDTGISYSLRMPTPEPGTYNYPDASAFQPAAEPGHPEVYSLWVFVFNFPEDCEDVPCSLADFGAGRGAPGAFSGGGHVVGGQNLQISGRVTFNSDRFGGASPLLEPRTAEVHLAVAPHGVLLPEVMPLQISTPIGNPNFWWLALFLPQ